MAAKNYVHKFLVLMYFTVIFPLIRVQCFQQKMDLDRFNLSAHLDNKTTREYRPLIDIYNPVDIARGFPNFLPPSFMRNALSNVTESLDVSLHQYSAAEGHIELRKEIAGMYSTLINRTLDPTENVIVTVGSLEAIYLSVLAHTSPGDEWIVIEPAFGFYFSTIKIAGGLVRPVTLKLKAIQGKVSSRDLVLDKDELRKTFNSRTKGIILNNPHNPTGKMFTKEELLFIAELAIKWNTFIICDEVYEMLVFDSNKHIRIASLGEDIYRRTITICSLSKAYSATGWRIGWAYGPTKLINNLKGLQPYIVFSVNTFTQVAAAQGLRKMRSELGRPDSYFVSYSKQLEDKRNFMVEVLDSIGMEVIVPQSGYFIYANWTNLKSRAIGFEKEHGYTSDVKFVKWLIKNVGVRVSPGIETYVRAEWDTAENFIRICFVKTSETLEKAALLLKRSF